MGRNFLNMGWDGMKNRMGWDGLGMNPGRKTDFSFGTVPLNIPTQNGLCKCHQSWSVKPSIYDFQKLFLKCNAQIVKSVRGISIFLDPRMLMYRGISKFENSQQSNSAVTLLSKSTKLSKLKMTHVSILAPISQFVLELYNMLA